MKRTVKLLYDNSFMENSRNQKIRKEDQKSQVEVKGAAWCVGGRGRGRDVQSTDFFMITLKLLFDFLNYVYRVVW